MTATFGTARRAIGTALGTCVALSVCAAMVTVSGISATAKAQSPRRAAISAPVFQGEALYVSETPSSTLLKSPAGVSLPGRRALAKIASQSQAQWVGDWVTTAKARTHLETITAGARRSGAVLPLVVYNIPSRDCGSYSGGGAAGAAAYRAWVDAVAAGIGDTKVMIVLEPDALAGMDCLAADAREQRLAMLRYAGTRLSAQPNAAVYLDAGNARWKPVALIAERLIQAGVAGTRGFALNVANFDRTESEVGYGRQIAALVGGKPFVVDTSRNGNGVWTGLLGWCNPPGRALGERPTTDPGLPGVDALLWVKTIGSSDGACRPGFQRAGTFSPAYAVGLARRASW